MVAVTSKLKRKRPKGEWLCWPRPALGCIAKFSVHAHIAEHRLTQKHDSNDNINGTCLQMLMVIVMLSVSETPHIPYPPDVPPHPHPDLNPGNKPITNLPILTCFLLPFFAFLLLCFCFCFFLCTGQHSETFDNLLILAGRKAGIMTEYFTACTGRPLTGSG
jgi:hypothetical protein